MHNRHTKILLGAFLLAAITSVRANEVGSEVERDLISFEAFDQLLAQDPPPTDAPTKSPVADDGENVPRTPRPSPPPTTTPTGSGAPSISNAPTSTPSKDPSAQPSGVPTGRPTSMPSTSPSKVPSASPSISVMPSKQPTGVPSLSPTKNPTGSPTISSKPSAEGPTTSPSLNPSSKPSSTPSSAPSATPSLFPSDVPSKVPSPQPSNKPTTSPSKMPTNVPSINPTGLPTIPPTKNPTGSPTKRPTPVPTRRATPAPTFAPTACPNPTACVRFQGFATGFFEIEKCASSCSFDIQCKQGLVCYQRNLGQRNVPGCIGNADEIGNGDFNFCVEPPSNQLVLLGNLGQPSSAYPLRRCAGDCDSDADCASGLFCFERNGSEGVPGCIGGGQPGFDYCYSPGSGFERLVVFPDQEFDYYELGQCEGDCDFDSDCEIGLICYERDNDSGNVPTCVGNANQVGFGDDDFCIPRPRSDTLISVFENEVGGDVAGGGLYPIPRCAGDCDSDVDCLPGLTCYQRAGFNAVPGCTGEGEEDFDYCI